MALILLRHLPDVEIFEYRFAEHKRVWDEDYESWAADISDALFGISDFDFDDDNPHEDRFQEVFRMMRNESDEYWAKHGWDVTDGNGKQLEIMDCLTRPMVSLVEKLHPEARFTHGTEAWGKSLEEEAKNWRPRR